MLRSLSLFLIICFSVPGITFGQQIIVRLSPSVLISEKASGLSKYISNSPELNSLLAQRPPGRIRKLFRHTKRELPLSLSNIYIWQYEGEDTARQVTSDLRGLSAVVYAQENRAFKISLSPDDADYAEQWYLPAIDAERAWDIERGNPSVIVGVIDTGIDYNHEDLQGQLWVNSPEDINQNGRLDSLDLNGIDDDGNGYIDDVIGWDFTDAPNFPDQGDFRDPDNDPMDEFSTGHGTPIAGIISAAQNNQIGISGLAPGARVMALRAGTASGFLEEDDVAEAIIYAIDNGCHIVNMSFGDFTISYLLRDAIRYGESEGLIFVAASGNSGNTVLQYPAALDETIAVGATTRTDSLASFSTGGSKLNLVAPGQEIYSCQIGNSYGFNNGTSFSAPVVSGALALIWSFHPNFSPQEIKGALYAGCTDLGKSGWDISYGHGLVNVFRSLQIIDQGFAEISHPGMNDGFAVDQLAITGTVFSPSLYSFSLSYGAGETPREWFQIAEVTGQQVIEDTLTEWDISSLPDTTYTIELVLRQNGLQDIISRTIISIDHTPPVLDSLKTTGMFEGPDDGFLIDFLSDDPTLAILFYGEAGGSLNRTKVSQYFQNHHYFLLTQEDVSGDVEFYLKLENASGLERIYDNNGQNYHLFISPAQPLENVLMPKEQLPFSGYFLTTLTDFDFDENPEIVLSEKTDSIQYGKLQIWEYQDDAFQLRTETASRAIPRDAADINGNGSLELLAGFGETSLILGTTVPGQFPQAVVWIDETNIWGSRLVNLDDDPQLELLAIKNEQWSLFDMDEQSYQPVLQQSLPNPTSGENRYGIPWSIVDDLDGDNQQEIIFGDYDGDVMIFEENASGQYESVWSKRLPGIDATYLLQTGDVNGDGKKELVTVVRNEPAQLTESTVIARYWSLTIWQASGDNQFVKIWEKNFHGVSTERTIFNGLTVADLDADGKDEIFFTPFPALYLIKFNDGQFQLRWYQDGINTNTVLLNDLDNNGRNDLLLNTITGVQQFEYALDSNRPAPPLRLKATPLDTDRVVLNWLPSAGADYYKIYRKAGGAGYQLIDSTTTYSFLDSALHNNQLYSYAVTRVDFDFTLPESFFSKISSATPNSPPELDSLCVSRSRQILLYFNEPMSADAFHTEKYSLTPRGNHPLSAIRGRNSGNIILSFLDEFNPGENHLVGYHLSDAQGTPMREDSLNLTFFYELPGQSFYLKEVTFLSKKHLKLMFNNPVEPNLASQIENYQLLPDGRILSASVDSLDARVVNLFLDPQNRMGSLGVKYTIRVINLQDVYGDVIRSDFGNQLNILREVTELTDVIVYPNPFRLQSGRNELMFANIPLNSEIYIYSASGKFIKHLIETGRDGGVGWNLLTGAGKKAGSGVYFYIVRNNGSEIKGKFLIIR